MSVFDLFSRRKKLEQGLFPDVYQYDKIPGTLRVQFVHIMDETIGKSLNPDEMYHNIVSILRKEYGLFALIANHHDPKDIYLSYEELRSFIINTTETDKIIDAFELVLFMIDKIFRNQPVYSKTPPKQVADNAILEFNQRAKEQGVGYQYNEGKIIRFDSEYIHKEVVVKALVILNSKKYENAKNEFMSAHEHYRHGRKAEVLVDCLKAFESVMKIICDKRGWKYDKTKGANELVRACFDNKLVPDYWQTHFSGLRSILQSGIPTPRNRQGGHGAGSQPPQTPPDALVAYVLHMTASTILYLSEADAAMP